MSKKGKNKKSKTPAKKSKNLVPWIAGAIILSVAVLAISGNLPFIGAEREAGKSFNLDGEETRPVLDPYMFIGQARAAYAAAKKYPDVLNQVFCYCFCNAEPFNHKTLLSCFTDKHGAG